MEKHTHCVIPVGGTGNFYAYERYPEKQLQLFDKTGGKIICMFSSSYGNKAYGRKEDFYTR